MATFVENMCPEDAMFAWPIFVEEMERWVNEGRSVSLVTSLNELNGEGPEARDKLVRFVSNSF